MRLSCLLYLRLSLLLTCLAGCAVDPLQHADDIASQAGLQRQEIAAGPFVLTAYARLSTPGQPLMVYLEGDGRAWLGRTVVSPDPTPRQAVGLQLATRDPAANVLYLARPCQFTPMARNPQCQSRYWTDLRYAPEVIEAIDAALSSYVARLHPSRLDLVGYSGGGAVAVLVAARRHDVASLRTVAGNLDQVAVNAWHQVSPMPGSLNPIDVAAQVARLPQLHFSGADDSVVPTAIARGFVAQAAPCAALHVIPAMGHEGDWAALWPTLLQSPLPCQ